MRPLHRRVIPQSAESQRRPLLDTSDSDGVLFIFASFVFMKMIFLANMIFLHQDLFSLQWYAKLNFLSVFISLMISNFPKNSRLPVDFTVQEGWRYFSTVSDSAFASKNHPLARFLPIPEDSIKNYLKAAIRLPKCKINFRRKKSSSLRGIFSWWIRTRSIRIGFR